jgi:hypothetical protein
MKRLTRAACLASAFAAVLAVAPTLAFAQEGGPRTDLPFTPKGQRGAYNGRGGSTKEGPGETSPYKSAKEHYEALKRAANGGTKLGPNELPDWSGVWNIDGGFVNFDPSLARDATHYGPLSPDNQKFYEKTLADLEKGIEWDALSYCLPAGFPRWISEPFLRDFAVTPTVTYLINEQQSEVRRVYTDGRDHRPEDEAFPLWEGDSIGFWDGKGDNAKLVIWTNNLKPGVYHRNGPRYSDKAEVIEVMQKVDPTHIKVDLTIYDPVDLTRPWTVHRGYVKDRLPNGHIDMWSCEENNNVVKTDAGGSNFVLPGEAGYKDPNTRGDPTKQQGQGQGNVAN